MALHAGAAGALLVYRRRELLEELAQLDSRRAGVIGLGTLPAGLAGLWLEQHIDRTLGKPGTIAAGLFAGGLAMGLADLRPQTRRAEEASALDGLWLGLAQACALVPGISRNGATLAAARGRQFMRVDAELLSRQLAVPVIIGATVLKAWRLSRDHAHRDAAGTELGLAALASSASTLLSVRLLEGLTRGRPLLPYAIYRAGLAAVILVRLRRDSRAPRRRPARA